MLTMTTGGDPAGDQPQAQRRGGLGGLARDQQRLPPHQGRGLCACSQAIAPLGQGGSRGVWAERLAGTRSAVAGAFLHVVRQAPSGVK